MTKPEAAPAGATVAPHPLNRHLFIIDNYRLLRSLDNDSIDLVVTDPPFGKNDTFVSDGLKPPLAPEELADERDLLSSWGITNRKEAFAAGVEWPPNGGEASYSDIWTWHDVHNDWGMKLEKSHKTIWRLIQTTRKVHSEGHGAYLAYMAIRLIEIQRVLKPTGSIYLHCDHTAGAYLRMLMDAVFGKNQFRNEIVWGYEKPRSAKKIWRKNHDIILFYSNSDKWTFNPQRVPTLDGKFEMRKPFKRPDGSVWKPKEPGKQASSWWYDIPSFATRMTAKERTGYPTQKPVALAERIIKASSNPGDVVLDPFAGCAYVPVAAEGLSRQWIAADISIRSLTVVKRQLAKFAYSTDGAVIPKAGEDQGAMLAVADVAIKGPGDLPQRTDIDPEPAPEPFELPEPDFFGKLFTDKEAKELLLSDSGWMCWCCGFANRFPDGELIESAANFHLDHVDPSSAGGGDHIFNRAPLCQGCNSAKGNDHITLRALRKRVAERGDLRVRTEAELPDLAKMTKRATDRYADRRAKRMAELGLL